ncbi:sigma-E factor negative regulatory protein [Azohydromonas lata]|uniref:Sigma-E factor negative regulatory protein n=1 Tax=Azohydromonas lata TaxID=45677 RepID=A0ABU5ICL8_9BURK|nr:sigma-E factor negative regulatory protein [Azohydromonas lata]MDZ5456564.1 sigma-E factor negative regulatory protein [Azohydromonas lata]
MERPMPDDRHDPSQPEQALSALMDGELDSAAAARLADACRGDARLRAAWHSYHLIGDVMRSQDLAQRPAHDAAFLSRLRERLADEPVLLAPQPVAVAAAAPSGQRRWRLPRRAWAASAVAAGAMAVGGVLVATRLQDTVLPPPGGGAVVAQAPRAPQALVGTTLPVAGAPEATPVVQADDRLLRDARLDRYLSAHKQWGSSFATPVVAVHNAAAQR